MSGSKQTSDFDSRFQPRSRVYRRPRIAVRQRVNEHPMAMFTIFVFASLSSMALAPTTGPAFASMGTQTRPMDGVRSTEKADRLPLSETAIACQGQAWGSETADCLVAIAKDGKREPRKVRLIASAEAVHTTPNVF